jgi:hypothetical protein
VRRGLRELEKLENCFENGENFPSLKLAPFLLRLHRHDGCPQWRKTRAVAGNFSSRRGRETTIEYKLCRPGNIFEDWYTFFYPFIQLVQNSVKAIWLTPHAEV